MNRRFCFLKVLPRAILQWYIVLFVAVLVIMLGLVHVWALSNLMDAPVEAPELESGDTTTINREALDAVLEMLERREQTFESLQRTKYELVDPGN